MITSMFTLTDHLLQEEGSVTGTTESLTHVLNTIEDAAKMIADQVRVLGLAQLFGKTGGVNSFGEEVQKLDLFANQLLVDRLLTSGVVYAVVSEELEQPVFAPPLQTGEYIVYIDPIDGSSNIDINGPTGTIFSIYRRDGGFLQQGNRQVACGYVMYGPSVMFVYTRG